MTFNQLKKLNPKAAEEWGKSDCPNYVPLTDYQLKHTFRAYNVNGRLYAVWNNGCFYEPFKFVNGQWVSIADTDTTGRGAKAKYYQQACKTLGRQDRAGGFYG